MSSSWSPDQASLQQLVAVLNQTLSPDNAVQRQAAQQLKNAQAMPDINKYLAYLLVTDNLAGVGDAASNISYRPSAGILLKNNIIKHHSTLDPLTVAYIKGSIVPALSSRQPQIPNIAGNVITTLLAQTGLDSWPEILPTLVNMVESDSNEFAISTLAKICEDMPLQLDSNANGPSSTSLLIPKFIDFMHSQAPKIRSGSIACINNFIPLKSQPLVENFDRFLTALFALATDDSFADTRSSICSAFVAIITTFPENLAPHLQGIISFILHCVKDRDNENVALQAAGFLVELGKTKKVDKSLVSAELKEIIPIVLSSMIYCEEDQARLESLAEDDENVDDRPEDIRPKIVKSKSAHANNTSTAVKNIVNESDSDSDFDDEDDEDDDDDSDWNLRKCSAAALDNFSHGYPEEVLEYAMPHLRSAIVSQSWPVREASILAFGAISHGCLDLVGPNLPELIPFLVNTLKDTVPAVRQITCWTLTRYSSWIAYHSSNGKNHERYLQPVLEGILDCCIDKNKKVQESACCALATLAEDVDRELAPYLEIIFTRLSVCFQRYRAKNIQNLFDAVHTILECVGPEAIAQHPKVVDILIPPLFDRWNNISDDDRDIWALFELMTAVATNLGTLFAPFASDVYNRALQILSESLIAEQNCQNDDTLDSPDKEFAITALDLIDGLVLGLGTQVTELIKSISPPLEELIMAALEDSSMDVRQSAFSLIGDLATTGNTGVLQQYLEQILETALAHMDMQYGPGVFNNAVWATGEISLQVGTAITPFIPRLFTSLAQILVLGGDDVTSGILENTAITIGRLGQIAPDLLKDHLALVADNWVANCHELPENAEKDSAFTGFARIVAANPQGVKSEESLVGILDAFASYHEPSPALQQRTRELLEGYRSLVGEDEWARIVDGLSDDGRIGVKSRYGL